MKVAMRASGLQQRMIDLQPSFRAGVLSLLVSRRFRSVQARRRVIPEVPCRAAGLRPVVAKGISALAVRRRVRAVAAQGAVTPRLCRASVSVVTPAETLITTRSVMPPGRQVRISTAILSCFLCRS